VDRYRILDFVEQYAVIADAKPTQPSELTAERLDVAFSELGVPVDRYQNLSSGWLIDSADLSRDIRLKANLLH
jgi:hypothetical protein